ncbi:hypothetical protein HMPREF0758_3461 [Serratia odorifera DSM 4582]|uniref:Uncharacterized protein n=1 Tax=Serratia odorifera DSM 4582 TaxID=667129 RepID=D4E5L1_SEROD|nr:hypothetical protein HMPREF0758_3461 [Serratia odorifera DSM 4582]
MPFDETDGFSIPPVEAGATSAVDAVAGADAAILSLLAQPASTRVVIIRAGADNFIAIFLLEANRARHLLATVARPGADNRRILLPAGQMLI